jgi:flagellar protein FlaJ
MPKMVKPAITPKMPETLKPAVLYPKKTSIAPVTSKPIKKEITEIEKETLRRIKKKEKKVLKKKEKKASTYVRLANKFFSGISKSLLDKGYFKNLKRNLVKANMQYLTRSYVSVIFFNALVSLFVSLLIVGFLLFFNIGVRFPFITPMRQDIITRFLSLFWLLIVIPVGTYLFTFFYPLLEKTAIEAKINQELPFATIHMASISESMVEPSNIFKIIISTGEYPALEKEFTKLLNEINVFGHDLVTSLRNVAFNSPSRRLSELLDGLATTITSGGDLSDFFDKRAQSLLFEYRLEREKQTKSAETFMDIYISVVIAAPMILRLLLIMMRISGLGIALSTSMIALIMVLGVSIVNIVFLSFLQLKQRNQ